MIYGCSFVIPLTSYHFSLSQKSGRKSDNNYLNSHNYYQL